MNTVFQDIRYATRILTTNPGFTAVAVLSLALGIGANSAIFSLADALLLRPLPVLAPGEVVSVTTRTPDDPFGGMSYPDYRDLRSKAQSLQGMVAYQLSVLGVTTSPKEPPQVRLGALVSENFFDVLGVRPELGRGFVAEEGKVSGRDAVAVVSHDFWQNELAGDSAVIGRTIRIKGLDFNIVGVAPKDFTGMSQYYKPALYLPAAMARKLGATGAKDPLEDRGDRSFTANGRLKPGMSREQAQADLATLWSGLQQQYPETDRGRAIAVMTELQSRIRQSPPDATLIAMLMGLAGMVLLISCANVASLLLGRARSRTREIALRVSLGASRIRLLRQLLTESLLLGLLGGAVGLWLGYGGILFLQTIRVPTDPPVTINPRLDARVLVFSLLAAAASAIVFGLAPALRSLNTDLVTALKASSSRTASGGRTIGRNVLVIVQVALAMVLLVSTGMLLSGFRRILARSPGFATDHRLMMEFDTTLARYTAGQTRDFYKKLADQSRQAPGVRSVTLARSIPFLPDQYFTNVIVEGYQLPKGQESESQLADIIDENYFPTLGVQMAEGRAFTADDKEASRRVAIVNEQFAKVHWPNQDALGKKMRLNDAKGPWLEVVGVAKTAKYLFVGETPTQFLYLPFAQNQTPQMLMVVQTWGDPASIEAPMRELVRGLDANQPVFNVRTLSSYYQHRAIFIALLITELVSAMGLLGLVLALVGLYGLVAYSVSRRTQEIGIRMAIGASRSEVLKMVLRQGLTLSGIGILVGALATFAAIRVMAAAFLGLGALSPVTFMLVPLGLVLVTLAACYIPARRASMVDPMVALHYE